MIVITIMLIASFGLGRVTAQSSSAVRDTLRVRCTYPYKSDGFLTEDCAQLISIYTKQGYRISHNTSQEDGSVIFTVN